MSPSLKHGVHSGATFQKKSLNQVSSSLSGFRHGREVSSSHGLRSIARAKSPAHSVPAMDQKPEPPSYTARAHTSYWLYFHQDCLFRAGPTGRKMQVWKVNYHKQASISKSLISVPEMDIWDTMQRKGKLTEPLARKKNSLSPSQNHIHLFWIYCRNTCSGNEFMPVVL